METILQTGYGRASITPTFSVPLAGYGATERRMSQNILSELYGTCVAFVHGEEKLLLFSQDLIRCDPKWTEELRANIEARTGVPGCRVMSCCTHTHSAPDVLSDLPCIQDYKAYWLEQMTVAAEEALADLAPSELYGTTTQTEHMTFVRHYRMADGTYAGPNFGSFTKSTIVDHAAPNDPQMLIVKIQRQDKKDILLVNFQAHPTSTGGNAYTDVSADFVGVTRDYMEADSGMHFAYFTGSAGNQVMASRIPEEGDNLTREQRYKFGNNNYLIYGWRLAQYVKNALPQLKKMKSDTFALTSTQLELAVNHEDEELYDAAVEVRKLFQETDRVTATRLAHQKGLSSVYHAGAIVLRRKRPLTNKMELNAVRIGDFGFVTLPFESFAAQGLHIKANSRVPLTMIFSCANAGWNYIPTREAYEYGCYESFTSYFAKGSGEIIAEKVTEMINSL